ncbi:MAG: transpeptidase-transglycosylase [Rhodospirillales bacterium 70-18]|nr:MAG: transpeptidase-transglycosylase [Rhodospirillales bacterium 70-18]
MRGPAGGAAPRRARWRLLRWAVVLGVWGAVAMGLALLWFAWDLPRPEAALDAARRPSLTLADDRGHIIATFGDVVGEPLRLSQMSPWLPKAAVAVEDRRFWSHMGLDLVGIARAAFVNLRAGRLVQGGSTITQQVAKNLFLTNARTFRRKVQELLLTLWLERHFTKREILEIWLNRVYLGSGAWGVDAAAHLYFGVSARDLSLWQAAVIAGLPRAPSRFNPRADPQAAAARGREVLAAMADTGAITAAQAQAASAEIAFPPRPSPASGWFADWAAEQVQAVLPEGADAVVRTTMDLPLQGIVEARLAAILDGPGKAAGVGQAAVVVLDAATGGVQAMAGGRDYRTSPYNRAVVARRQPGSSFKPFVWLAALEKGIRPDDPILDAPIRLGNWSPSNFERKYLGEITVEEALAQSINTVAVRLLIAAGGPGAVVAVAHRLGIGGKLEANDSIALGTSDVGLLPMTAAYATFFNGGRLVVPTGLAAVRADGHDVKLAQPAPVRVVNPDLAAMMARMLTAVVARGTGQAAAVAGHLVAGKTGTTQDYRDAWFIGYIGGRIIGVWMGNDDNAPMHAITGGTLPARLFHDIAAALPAP